VLKGSFLWPGLGGKAKAGRPAAYGCGGLRLKWGLTGITEYSSSTGIFRRGTATEMPVLVLQQQVQILGTNGQMRILLINECFNNHSLA